MGLALLAGSTVLSLLGPTVLADPAPRASSMDAASRFAAAQSAGVSAWRAVKDGRSGAATPSAPVHPPSTHAVAPPMAESALPAIADPPSPPAVPTSAPGTVTTVPATIAADCSRDVTAALNAWMRSVADGATLSFGAGACYRVDGTLLLSDRRDLTVDGNGAGFTTSLVPPTSPKITRQMWSVVGGSGITLRDMSVRGSNPTATFHVDREWFPLIQIAGTRSVLIEGVRGSNAWGDFVSIGPDVRRVTNSDGTGGVLAADVTVRGSSAHVIGRHGVTCNGCEDVVIDRNTFSDIAYQVVDIEVEADTWHARNVAFTNNTIAGRVNLSVLANAGIGRDVTNITVSGNTMTGTPVTCAPPIHIDDTTATKSGFVIRGNRFKTLGNALWLRGVSDVIVEDNVVSIGNGGCTDSGVAVIATNGQRNVVRDNDFTGARTLARAAAAATGTACGNRLTGTAFDQPQVCGAS